MIINDGNKHQSSVNYGVLSIIIYLIVSINLEGIILWGELYQTTNIVLLFTGLLTTVYFNYIKFSVLGKECIKSNKMTLIIETLFLLLGIIYTYLGTSTKKDEFDPNHLAAVVLAIIPCCATIKRLNIVNEFTKTKSKAISIYTKILYILAW